MLRKPHQKIRKKHACTNSYTKNCSRPSEKCSMENITLTVPNSVIPSTVFLLSIHTVENSVLLLMLSKQKAYFSFSKSHCLLSLPNSCHLQPLKHTTNVDFLILNCMQKKKKKSPTSDEIVANIQEF